MSKKKPPKRDDALTRDRQRCIHPSWHLSRFCARCREMDGLPPIDASALVEPRKAKS